MSHELFRVSLLSRQRSNCCHTSSKAKYLGCRVPYTKNRTQSGEGIFWGRTVAFLEGALRNNAFCVFPLLFLSAGLSGDCVNLGSAAFRSSPIAKPTCTGDDIVDLDSEPHRVLAPHAVCFSLPCTASELDLPELFFPRIAEVLKPCRDGVTKDEAGDANVTRVSLNSHNAWEQPSERSRDVHLRSNT